MGPRSRLKPRYEWRQGFGFVSLRGPEPEHDPVAAMLYGIIAWMLLWAVGGEILVNALT